MGRSRRLLKYVLEYWRGWAGILLASLLGTGFGLVQAWPMKVLVDHVLGRSPMPPALARLLAPLPGSHDPRGLLVWVVLAGLAVYAVNSTLEVILTRGWVRVGQRMVYDLSADLFAHLLRRSLLFHARNPVGDSIGRITQDCWCLHTIVDDVLFKPKLALISAAAMIGLMAQLDLGLTLVALTIAPFLAGTSLLLGGAIRSAVGARREVESRIQAHVQRTLSGLAVVQAFGREDDERKRFAELADAALRTQRRGAWVGSLQGFWAGLAAALATVAILWIGVHRVFAGRLTVGGIIVFLSYLGLLQTQLRALAGLYTSLQGAAVGAGRVLEVLEADCEVRDRPGAVSLPEVRGHLRLEHVDFGYEPGRLVLRDVCLEVGPGEILAIVGPTGAGKSTLAGLIPRFFDPARGRVTLDGHDLVNLRLKSLRSQVALVLQESFFFPLTVAENIAYGRPGATALQVQAAARAACAHDFIERLPQGYDTILGERGATLSGGERQRLAIARALLMDAPILVLDEPTSALDAETESRLLDALQRTRTGRTTVIITHRPSLVERADRVLIARGGRFHELGSDADVRHCAGEGPGFEPPWIEARTCPGDPDARSLVP